MRPEERKVLATTCFGHLMSHYNMLVFPPLVIPLASRLNIPLAQSMELGFWMYLAFGLSALFWGLITDKVGAKPMLMLYFLGAGLCGLAAAFFIDSPLAFSMCLAGIGLFSGIYHPAGLGLVARGVERISLGMAYNGIFGNLGLALGPLCTGLVNWIWGPVAAYILLALLNFVGLAYLAASKIQEPPRPVGQEAKSTNGLVGPFLILLVCMMIGGFTYRGATLSVPPYLELKTPELLAAFQAVWPFKVSANFFATGLTSFIFLVGSLGQYLGGRFGDRYDPRWGYVLFHGLSLPALFAMAYLGNTPLFLAAMFYFFFNLGMQPMENTLVARLSPPAFKHSAFGAKFVLTFGVGALAVKAAGWVESGWGMHYIFTMLGGITVLLCLLILLLISRTRGLAR